MPLPSLRWRAYHQRRRQQGSRAYDLQGAKLGDFVGHTSDIWALAVSPDGKLLASASADQTLRVWDIAHRELLLSLFHGANGEWIAWTPSGYYGASARGDQYIGWHQNRGLDKAADYFPVARFATQRYRPELVSDAVQFGSETEALARWQQARISQDTQTVQTLIAQAPPAPRLIKAPQGTVSRAVQALTVGLDERAETLLVSVNGRPTQQQRGLARVQDKKVLTRAVNLQPGSNRIDLLARNRYGDSPVVSLEVTYQTEASADTEPNQDWTKPRLFLLAIGVSEYADPSLNLGFAAADAEALARRFQQEEGGLYGQVQVQTLLNQQATRANVLDSMDILNRMTQDDLAILFIAGHGVQDERGSFYFLPHDGRAEQLRSSAIKWLDFQEVTSSLPGKVILLADTCHSGSIYGTGGARRWT
ncbi:MAG: caspase family protein [Candidatus Competibacteraceae bacterium]